MLDLLWVRIGLIILTAGPQFVFTYLEMARWTDTAESVAGLSFDTAGKTEVIGRNMGLYNGLLGAGLAVSIYMLPQLGKVPGLLFVGFMLIAGVYGGLTLKPPNYELLLVQALPALLALGALIFMEPSGQVRSG